MEKKILKQVPVFMPYVLHVFYKDLLQIYFLITKRTCTDDDFKISTALKS